MLCPNCNSLVNEGSAFCEMCGAPLSGAAATDQSSGAAGTGAQADLSGFDVSTQPQYEPAAQQGQSAYASPQQPYGGPYGGGMPQSQPTPPAYSYGQPQQQGSNTPFVLAIVSLACMLTGILAPVALVLAIVALVMNSKQKKQGIVNTKQTPTNIMSIISIVLSAITLVMFLVAGAAVIAAVESGEFDTTTPSSTTTQNASSTNAASTASSAASTAAGASGAAAGGTIGSASSASATSASSSSSTFAGTWQLDSMLSDGKETSAKDIETMRELGLDVTLELEADGTASFVLFGEPLDGTWSESGGQLNLKLLGEAIPVTYENDLIIIQNDSDLLRFRKAS